MSTRLEIGFDRTVRRVWLDAVANALATDGDINAADEALHAAVAAEVRGVDARRKTIQVARRLLIRPVPAATALRAEAMRLLPSVSAGDRVALHWGLALATYPFVAAAATQVGRVGALQGEVTKQQIERRLREIVGDREIVGRAWRHVLASFADWGALEPLGRGRYAVRRAAHTVQSAEVARWLLEAAFVATERVSVELPALLDAPSLFPFVLTDVGRAAFVEHPRLVIVRQGAGVDIITRAG